MARQRKLTPERKALIQSLLSHYKPEDAQDVQAMLRDLLGDTIQQMLEAEMDDHLVTANMTTRTSIQMTAATATALKQSPLRPEISRSTSPETARVTSNRSQSKRTRPISQI